MEIVKIKPEHNQYIANIIRYNLKANGLDIPGTVYFDKEVDYLSEYYNDNDQRDYYVLLDDNHRVVGGIGIEEFKGIDNCAELQKLYLDDSVKGFGYGYKLIEFILDKAKSLGYDYMYLETHHNLEIAIHTYQKSGFEIIERLPTCNHSTMDVFLKKQL